MSIELPKPIAGYVAANARLDVDGMLEPFAADAVVLDNGHRRHENGRVVVEGLAHGDFKGSPIRFTYAFTLENDAIKALEITI